LGTAKIVPNVVTRTGADGRMAIVLPTRLAIEEQLNHVEDVLVAEPSTRVHQHRAFLLELVQVHRIDAEAESGMLQRIRDERVGGQDEAARIGLVRSWEGSAV